jgi:hypothetical protein
MPNLRIKHEGDTSVSTDLVEACDSLSAVLRPLDPNVEISALITMVCRCAVVYGLNKNVVLKAIDDGYDAFMLAISDDGPMQ